MASIVSNMLFIPYTSVCLHFLAVCLHFVSCLFTFCQLFGISNTPSSELNCHEVKKVDLYLLGMEIIEADYFSIQASKAIDHDNQC